MEGSAEVNESMENPTEDPHLKRKENDQLHQQTENCIALQRSAPVIAEETGWTEHLSSLRSPEMLLETLVGKGPNYDSGAHSDSEHPPSSCPSTFPGTFLDELKVSNINLQNVYTNVSGNGGDDSHIRKGLWNNLTRLVGGSRIDSVPKDLLSVLDRGKVGGLLVKRPLPFPQFDFNHLKAPQNLAECDNPVQSRNTLAFPRPGIRTKVLPASGFQQFLVKSSLKGKGVAYCHQGVDKVSRLVTQNQNSVGIDDNVLTTTQPMHKPMTKVNEMTLIDGVGVYAENVQCDGTCLREWLKEKNQKSSRFKRLNMFKKILELVDTLHSQGIALRHIQPSYFVVFPSGIIKYIDSLNTQVQARILKGSKYQDISLESHLKRKRPLEQNTDFQGIASHKQLKVGQGQELLKGPLSLNHLKLGEKNSTVALSHLCPSRSCLKGSLVEEVYNGIARTKSYDEGFSEEFKLAESFQSHEIPGQPKTFHSSFREPVTGFLNLEDRWYTSPEELNESACSLSSNIYRLGVLFFELLCYFETQEVHFAAMSNLRHRILPPSFLSEFPKEASFCLWLLHPDPYSRPKSREILSSNLMFECNNVSAIDQSSASIDEEDAEADILLHFLSTLREQKENQAAKLVADIQCVEADVEEVERRHSSRIESLSNARGVLPSSSDSSNMNPHEASIQIGTNTACSVSILNEERLMKNIDRLEHAYFSMRSNIELSEPNAATRSDVDVLKVRSNFYRFQDEADIKEESEDHVGTFFEGLCKFARYSKVEVRGSLRNADILNSANVICSLSFDRDEDYFATAGVSKKIKIFEFGALLNETVDVHYPLVEMSSRSKLSCVSWNYYIKNYLASTDYDGVVQLWDASTGQGFTQYAEHEKRAWSVDFSPVDPTKLASGSDDCSVKVWSIKERNCIDTIRNVANVCCVQFSPHSSHLLTFGSADYKIYCYDLRNTRSPWCILSGHGKAVSYVKFVDCETIVSASTDNTLKLWDLNKTSACGQSTNACRLTFTGHTNEKNFVGLSTFDGYISCGSETNEVYVYHKAFPMCITSHKFGSIDPITGQETGDDNGQFVSSVCWRTKSSMVVAANSSGNLKLLQMV